MSYTQGWLEKKSGGKEPESGGRSGRIRQLSHQLEKWTKRYFVLVGTELRYFKSDDDYNKGKAALGSVECTESTFRLKDVTGMVYRFSLVTAGRELKLRGISSAFHMWKDALAPLVKPDDEGAADVVSPSPGEAEGGARDRSYTEGQAPPTPRRRSWTGRPSISGASGGVGAVADGPWIESGWLDKKSGGKDGSSKSRMLDRWSKRWFVLVGTELRYYKSEEDARKGKVALGMMVAQGATLTLKHVKGQTFRFTVHNAQRELKLRASGPVEYQKWTRALMPLSTATREADEGEDELIIVGDSNVGKTSLLVRFVEGRYDGMAKPTIAVDISSANLDLGSSTVALSLWDTAGQERYAPLSTPYFRSADGVIIAFDVGSRASFDRVASYWHGEVEAKAEPDVSVMLVGTKCDIDPEERQVSMDGAQAFAEEMGWLYFETSAKLGVHVRDAFYLLACTVMNRMNEADPANLINGGKGIDVSGGGGGKPAGKGGCC